MGLNMTTSINEELAELLTRLGIQHEGFVLVVLNDAETSIAACKVPWGMLAGKIPWKKLLDIVPKEELASALFAFIVKGKSEVKPE